MPKEKRKGKLQEEGRKVDIDFGIGGLGGIFGGIGKLIDSVTKMAEEGKSAISEKGEIKGLGDKARGVYGFTVRTLAGGESKVEPFGNIKKTPKGPKVEEEREPITDVFDEKKEIIVIAEMPGVNEKDIKVDLRGDILDILAQNKDRKYHKEVLLPAKVKSETPSSSYQNGILRVRMKK